MEGEKIGGRWLVEPVSLARRARLSSGRGRLYTPANAWAVLFLASKEDAPWVHPVVRSRLRRALNERGLKRLRPRLVRRGKLLRFYVHPGELKRVAARKDVMRTGISAVGHYGMDLLAGAEFDAYADEAQLPRIVKRHALERVSGPPANVVLRTVPHAVWEHIHHSAVAPLATVAIDLFEEPDSRSSRIGGEAVDRIDRERNEADENADGGAAF